MQHQFAARNECHNVARDIRYRSELHFLVYQFGYILVHASYINMLSHVYLRI